MGKRFVIGAAVAALVAGSQAAPVSGSSGGGSDASDADPIVIGVSLPLTGDFSEPGKGVQRGYEACSAARSR